LTKKRAKSLRSAKNFTPSTTMFGGKDYFVGFFTAKNKTLLSFKKIITMF
jgi:hypothetical protein